MRVINPHYKHTPLKFVARGDFPAFEGAGDDQGVFDVPDAWGKWLCSTKGWTLVAEVAQLKVEPAAPKVPEPDAALLEPGGVTEPPLSERDPVDLSRLNKAELIALAAQRGLMLTAEQQKLKAFELRAMLSLPEIPE
jgi:hypothetical protein